MRKLLIVLALAVLLAPNAVVAAKQLGLLGDRHLAVIQGRGMRCAVVDGISGDPSPAISCVRFEGPQFDGPMIIIEETP